MSISSLEKKETVRDDICERSMSGKEMKNESEKKPFFPMKFFGRVEMCQDDVVSWT